MRGAPLPTSRAFGTQPGGQQVPQDLLCTDVPLMPELAVVRVGRRPRGEAGRMASGPTVGRVGNPVRWLAAGLQPPDFMSVFATPSCAGIASKGRLSARQAQLLPPEHPQGPHCPPATLPGRDGGSLGGGTAVPGPPSLHPWAVSQDSALPTASSLVRGGRGRGDSGGSGRTRGASGQGGPRGGSGAG